MIISWPVSSPVRSSLPPSGCSSPGTPSEGASVPVAPLSVPGSSLPCPSVSGVGFSSIISSSEVFPESSSVSKLADSFPCPSSISSKLNSSFVKPVEELSSGIIFSISPVCPEPFPSTICSTTGSCTGNGVTVLLSPPKSPEPRSTPARSPKSFTSSLRLSSMIIPLSSGTVNSAAHVGVSPFTATMRLINTARNRLFITTVLLPTRY